MGQRQLRDCLPDDGQQRAGSLELELDRPCVHARAQSVGRTNAEGGKARELGVPRPPVRPEQELQDTDRRLP